ncbi:MAG: T9SS type A sorting domain-containing protein [Bacteroidales bacterium]|nr:T9SS type A sorting domain-containing protein [Bacteroidales bacterium]
MKRFLLSAIAIFAISMCSFAQSIVCTDNACTAITDQTFSNTSVPYYCPQSLTFEHGQAVDVCITIKCPQTTNVTVSTMIGPVDADATIESLTITGFSNMPNGLTYCVNRVDMDPTNYNYATIHITGTAPSTNGDYNLEMSCYFTGTASAYGFSNNFDNEAISFTTGIVLTIGEGNDTPEPSEIVCDEPCPAVTNQPMSQTTIPYYAPEELNYNVNEAVDVCITIQCPANTNVEYMGMQAAATITSLTITGFANLPEGLSYCVSRTEMDPTTNNFATLHLTGTPTTAGEYNLNLSCNVTGTANVFGSDMPLNNQAITFPTGIVVTIEEETSEFIEAHFTANPEIHDNYGDMGFVSIYQGESITFTNASTNAHHIVWTFTGGDIETSTENVVTVTYAEVGSFSTTLTAYNADESESSTKTVTIGVTPQPQNEVVANFTTNPEATQLLGGSSIYITAGETITYTNTSENATSIAWTFEGGSPETSTDNTVEVTYATAGVYTTTLVAYGGNNTPSVKTVGVNVSEPQPQNEVVADFTTNPGATDGIIYILMGETITFTNTSINAHHILWTFPGGNPESSNENVVTVEYLDLNHTADYTTTATLTAYNEDESESDTKTIPIYVFVIYDNVDESAISEISVYPNPTSSVINISAEGMQNITIIDMTGRVVMSKDVNSNFETISAEGFAKANYMVRIATADGVVVKNIVVE